MKKIFSLFAAMLVAFAVNAQTDFAGGYNCTADDAVLSNVYGLSLETTSNPHCILCNEATWNVVLATWTVQASRGCYVTVSLDMGAAQGSNKHIFEVKISDSKGNAKGTLVEAKENAVADDVILLDGTILLPAAGEYTVELTSRRQYGKGRIKNVILTYDSDAPSEIVEVTSVELNKTEISLELEEVELLIATVSPDNATDPSVTWESDDEAIAKVNENGLVTAIAEGTANIKAKAGEKEAICAVTVVANTIPNVDFAGPCVLSGKKARLEGKIWKNENYKLYGNGDSYKHYGNALWAINITRPCVVSAVLNGVEGGHLFELDLFDANNDSITKIVQPEGKIWSKGEIALEGSFNITEAGVYTFRLRNIQEWSSGKVEGITLTAPKPLYLKPGIWNQGNEKFAIWDITNEKWSEFMVLAENETDIYTAEVAADAEKVIFARINGEAEAPNWDAKWNQTENLDILEDKDMFEISCWNCSAYGNSDGSWSKYVAPEPEPIPSYIAINGDWNGWVGNVMELSEDKKSASVTVSLDMGEYNGHGFKIQLDDKSYCIKQNPWYSFHRGHTHASGIDDVAGDEDAFWLSMDVAGDYTFTWTFATKTLEITFPAEPQVVALAGAMNEWSETANVFENSTDGKTASLAITFDDYYYEFKLVVNGKWLSVNLYEINRGNTSASGLVEETGNFIIKPDLIGAEYEYVFTWNYETGVLNVDFPEPKLENGWYLVGTFDGKDEWSVDKLSAAKKFELNPDETEIEEYKITVSLKAGDKFKAAYVYLDALQGDSYKPGGDSGDFTVDANHAGSSKAIYLRPNGDGGDDWYYHVLFVHANDTPMAVDNTQDGVTAKKVVENGMLIIEKNNVRYTVTGQVIR